MAKDIVIDENGEPLWFDAFDKLEKIKESITPELQTIKIRYEKNENSDYPRKLNFNANLTQVLFIAFSKFKKVPYNYAISVDAETFRDYANAYMELLSFIKGFYPDFIGSKATFTSFMGISANAYANILTTSQDADLVAEIESLNDKLCELEVVSAQSGISKEKSTETKLRADGVGYGLNLRPDIQSITINNNLKLDKENVDRRIASIFGSKMLENKKNK